MTLVCRIKRLHGASQGFCFVTQLGQCVICAIGIGNGIDQPRVTDCVGLLHHSGHFGQGHCFEYNLHGSAKYLIPCFVVDGKYLC